MKVRREFPVPFREIENTWVPMPDGTCLAARIWLPEDAEPEPVPAILEFIPYRKRDGTSWRDSIMHPHFAGHGYAAVRVDLRGSGDSEGLLEDEYCLREREDGLAVIAWLAAQPWCCGAIGMIGISWGGFNALQIAAYRPEALKAIITIGSTDDRYADDVHYMGGCLLTANFTWAQTFFSDLSRPPDPAIVGDRWREIWLHRLENATFFIERWLAHQRRDAFWRHGSVCEDYAAIECAVLAIGGWADSYTNAVPRLLAGLSCPRRGLIGPWGHDYPHTGKPGPAIDFLGEALRWWDHWLKGVDTGVTEQPVLRAFIQEDVPANPTHEVREGRWIGVDAWPPATSAARIFHLGHRELRDTPGEPREHRHISPQTLGAAAGEWCPYGQAGDLPADQRPDDAMSLVFDSVPLDEPLDVLGAPVADLEIAVDRPNAFLAVRLVDIAPDGSATRVSYGLLNLTHLDGHEAPRPVVPGTNLRATVQLCDIGHRFLTGHRIRLSISTTYWPTAWPSPEPVELTLRTDGSRLSLPVLAAEAVSGRPVAFKPGEGASPEARTLLSGRETRRSLKHDFLTGRETLTVINDDGIERIDAHGLEIGRRCEERNSIFPGDPLSAKVVANWTMRLSRGDWGVRTEAAATMTATADTFFVTARLDAYEHETRVASHSWEVHLPRDHV